MPVFSSRSTKKSRHTEFTEYRRSTNVSGKIHVLALRSTESPPDKSPLPTHFRSGENAQSADNGMFDSVIMFLQSLPHLLNRRVVSLRVSSGRTRYSVKRRFGQLRYLQVERGNTFETRAGTGRKRPVPVKPVHNFKHVFGHSRVGATSHL